MEYGFYDLITLLGALGLFLYGMKVMSDALMELAGDKMRNILATSTANRLLAIMTGVVTTALIQSSSATTLMVVSFVNANLLTLTEAVGVIMGANIGTTVTAWVISLLGFKIKMHAIALPLIGAGFLLTLSKADHLKNWGLFLIGFSILFIGLQFMKESVPDIHSHPEILSFLTEYTSRGYLSILLFIGIGTVLTLVVQSSSAAMALTLLMTFEGWLPFDMAAAMVIGQNIGTTITAILAAIVANYQAKRAARAHLLFNLIGVLWILLLFYPFLDGVNYLLSTLNGDSTLLATVTVPIALSLFHSSFNILNTVLLAPFLPWIVRIAEWMVPAEVPQTREIDQPRYLTPSSLQYPQTGIKALSDESVRLLQNSAYRVLAHGLWVHRSDLESDRHLKEIVENSNAIELDIDEIYQTQIKEIYSQILEYATELQNRFELNENEIEVLRNLLVADRLLVQVVKRMKPLQINIKQYLNSDNPAIRREYNKLRRAILKVVREIHRIRLPEELPHHLERLHKLRKQAKKLDVLFSGRIEQQLRSGEINRAAASSLLNDSANAMRITKNLVDVAVILYRPTDLQTGKIDEQNAQEFSEH